MKSQPDLSVYILCGGKSSRMGEEKGLVMLHGKSFLTWILEAVSPISSQIHLVTSNEKYASYGLPMIADLVENKGPVGGIYTALSHSQTGWNLLLSCDIPMISTEILRELIQLVQSDLTRVGLVTDGKNDYPLVGIYHKSLVADFESAILKDKLKLCPLVYSFPLKKLLVSPKRQSQLVNINTKEQLRSLN